MDITKFTKEEFQKAFNDTYLTIIKSADITNERKAFLLGGQPGAGKSGITALLEKENPNIIVINGDDFRKDHPHYEELEKIYGKESVEYTKGFAGKMTEALISKLSDEGYNLIIEGTLRTAETPLKTQQELANKGYQVEMAVIQVRPEFSYLGTLARYEQMIKLGVQPRATPERAHQEVVDNIANNLSRLYAEKVFSNIRLFNREGECLYSMKETPAINPGKLIEKEFKRMLNQEEKNNILVGYDKVLNYMSLRNASKDEIQAVLDSRMKIEAQEIKIETNLEKENPWAKKLENDKGLSLEK